ncbi:MAG: pyridoxal phosphate-dependent decarboxylase family protein [Phycisphaerales bacterium]
MADSFKASTSPESDNTLNLEAIDRAFEIARRYVCDDVDRPVNPYRSPDEVRKDFDLGLSAQGMVFDEVMAELESVMRATPRSTSKRFYNQLFGGRDAAATAADMLVPMMNTSLYTFKAAGPMTIIEEVIMRHMATKLGFEGSRAEGVFTPGGSISNLLAMLLGRNHACPQARNDGLDGTKLTCYVSKDSHYSIVKNAGILGIGRSNVRLVDVDSEGVMITSRLLEMIKEDKDEGHRACCVIATAGTTVLGAFDPIRQCGEIAREFGVWFHVDASFGGSAALSDRWKHLLDGVEMADSVAWNPHKVMGVPLSAAAFLTRQSGLLRASLDETADYLFQADDHANNPGTKSIQCGRRNDALKVWAAWKHHGDDGYRDRIEHLMDLAKHCARCVERDERFVLTREPMYVNVCFEVVGKSSEAICDALRENNALLVGHAQVDGRRIIRVPFVNGQLTKDDVEEMLGLILEAADSLPEHEEPASNDSCVQGCPSCS